MAGEMTKTRVPGSDEIVSAGSQSGEGILGTIPDEINIQDLG